MEVMALQALPFESYLKVVFHRHTTGPAWDNQSTLYVILLLHCLHAVRAAYCEL